MTAVPTPRVICCHTIPVTHRHGLGMKTDTTWRTDDCELAGKAKAIFKRGFVFLIEVVGDELSMAVVDPRKDGSVLHAEVSENAVGITDAAMVRLIEGAHAGLRRVVT